MAEGFVNMALDQEQKDEMSAPQPCPTPKYPYSLCISFDQDMLDRLDLDNDCNVGDSLTMAVQAKVTCVNQTETDEGVRMRVEMQITDIALPEEVQVQRPLGRARPY